MSVQVAPQDNMQSERTDIDLRGLTAVAGRKIVNVQEVTLGPTVEDHILVNRLSDHSHFGNRNGCAVTKLRSGLGNQVSSLVVMTRFRRCGMC